MIQRSDRVACIVGAGMVALAPASVAAQEPPVTNVVATNTPGWRLQVTADGTWYDNPYFLAADSPATWSTSGRASLGLEQSFGRGSVSLSSYGGTIYYPKIDSFNQATYGGSFNLDWAPSRRTQVQLGQTYDRSNTRSLAQLDFEGLPLPTSGFDTARTSASLTHAFSQRWQIGLRAAFTWREYDDVALIGGEQLYLTAELARRFGKHGAAYLSYGHSSSWLGGIDERAHQALVGLRHQTQHSGFDAAAGAAYLENVAKWYPAGHAGFTASGRKASLALRYSRDFGLAFGYGRQMIADLVSATLGYQPARRLELSAAYNYGYRRDPAVTSYRVRSQIASAGLGWGITRDLHFATRYYRERNDTQGFPVVDANRVTASLSYGVSWR